MLSNLISVRSLLPRPTTIITWWRIFECDCWLRVREVSGWNVQVFKTFIQSTDREETPDILENLYHTHTHTCVHTIIRHPKLFKDVCFASVLIVFQPLLGAVLLHSLCYNIHTIISLLTCPCLPRCWVHLPASCPHTCNICSSYNIATLIEAIVRVLFVLKLAIWFHLAQH